VWRRHPGGGFEFRQERKNLARAPTVREGVWRSLTSRAQNRRLEASATRRAGLACGGQPQSAATDWAPNKILKFIRLRTTLAALRSAALHNRQRQRRPSCAKACGAASPDARKIAG
jgi:hypothetical protein